MTRIVPSFLLTALLPLTGIMAQGDDCATAPAISCGAVVSGNTTAFTADVAPFCGVGDGAGGGVWYRFLGTGTNITASLCGSSYDTAIRVYTGACAAPTCVAGNGDFCGLQSEVTWASVLGTLYRILVHGSGASAGAYTLTITCATSMDVCTTNAPLLACGVVANGNTTGFGADAAPACTVGNGTGGGVWYRIIGTGVNITASLCGSSYDTAIRVYSGTCAALTCVAGNGDFCGLQSQVTWASAAGVTYYVLVHGFGAAVGSYTLTITCAAVPPGMCYATTPTPFVADPHAGTTLTLGDDQHSAAVNIGFSFCYNGTNYTQCVISSNDYITFNLANAGTFSPWVTVAVPNAATPEIRTSILNPWQDTYPPACAAGCIRYQTLGVAPNRRFVVSFQNVPMFLCNQLLFTNQMVLYEGSNCIGSFIQAKPICASWNSGKAVHALHNGAGTMATVVPGRNNTAWVANFEGRFFSPTCAPCSTAATVSCAIPTPIELLHFTGRNAGTANILEWATASEQNTDHFTVERSEDGEQFEPILVVQAAGNSHAEIAYAVKDEAPFHGVNYYRLRATDLDGSYEVFDVIAVHRVPPNSVLVYPNPAEGSPRYQLPEDLPLPATLIVRDLAGRVVRSIVVEAAEGLLNINGLAGGSYFLELSVPGPATAVRFVIE